MMLNPLAVAGLLSSLKIRDEKEEKGCEWEEYLSSHVKIRIVKKEEKPEEIK